MTAAEHEQAQDASDRELEASGDEEEASGVEEEGGDEEEDSVTFLSPFEFNVRDPITLVELRLRGLSGMIRQKPRWWEKVQDDVLVAKWRAEMIEYDRVARAKEWPVHQEEFYGPKRWPRDALTDIQLDYVFDELRYLAGQRDEKTGIHATSVPGVYQSASLIPAGLKQALVQGVGLLEDVPAEEQDWHPGSNHQVLDLIHPSLYCFRIGKSLVNTTPEYRSLHPEKDPLASCPLDKYLDDRDDLDVDNLDQTISRDFQWLPTLFEVSETEVECKGYINNLHPIKHAPLYPAISSILQRFVPMFEKVLSDSASPIPKRVIEVDVFDWYSHLPNQEPGEEGYVAWKANRWPLIPDPPSFTPPIEEDRVNFDLRGGSLRVIVKLANIILTPENPVYPGGSWHVEGMENEKIVATGLYYYASENITESRLAFRMQVGTDPECSDMEYQRNDGQGWRAAFGLSNEDSALNQELGYILAEEDKCVAFPNIYQHCVEPFELADRTRPGHRKILAFFLTDPFNAIVHSTTMVPPQQREWYLDEMERVPALRKLPRELFDIIASYALEGTITRAEAEADREELMEERKNFVLQHNEDVFEVGFSLCEH
ncbi:hypothetical protein L226DRAFT_495143 [Lentinus tigrinus ALCF2SS1-7]|uniref:Uncharacterized protein n=1 Tax=Lentinus tigrinus ALCF2SS1-6 TaxID=1328759 RepID=A0A5C2RQF4_9APHY|nr:hypothetical protein L227DRAFT_657973 [Lentinus tigrinus ALCF2SS1-6]RPD68800.1 hypothetical protein L226DRAFT_495143 [Lentinus tigrinus ALCF2SS1-7]